MSAKIWNKLFKRKTPKNEVVVDYEKCAKVKVKEEWNDNNSNNSDGKNQTTIVFGDSATATTPPQCQSKAATLKYIPPPVIPEPSVKLELQPCPICKRTFAQATLDKHFIICEKMQTKKRRIFDSSQQRRGADSVNYTPPPNLLDRASPPKSTIATKRKLDSKVSSTSSSLLGRQTRSNSTTSSVAAGGGDYVRKRSLSKEPVSERCPYCERNFGVKAYDRHVEWCKEKFRLNAYITPSKESAAKERLNARIKYKAPTLKTKRATTREKYSPFDDVFSKNYSHNDKARSEGRHSISNSMTSSMISESGFSDHYDPFMSAKRQLEELFLPTASPQPAAAASSTPKSAPKMENTKNVVIKRQTTTKPTQPQQDSYFRRSMSLRLPKRTSPKPPTFKTQTSTIQMGIDSDGPISTKFIKAEEFDETPVRSVYSTLACNQRLTPSPPAVAAALRSPAAASNRKNLRLQLEKINLPSGTDYPISKTDSLAAFLDYEKDLDRSTSPSFTGKHSKDKSNSLNKMTVVSEVVGLPKSDSDDDENQNDNDDDDNDDDGRDKGTWNDDRDSFNELDQTFSITTSTPVVQELPKLSRCGQIKLSPIDINRVNSIMKELEEDFDAKRRQDEDSEQRLDPQLINMCDNLSVSLSKLSDITTSSTESNETTKPRLQPLEHSNSERKVQLKRQLKLDKDHILYDKTPPVPSDAPESEAGDHQFAVECDHKLEKTKSSGKLRGSDAKLETYFDDFNFEEFINSFEDDEDNPIFKGYKEMLKSTTKLLQTDNSDPEDEVEIYYTVSKDLEEKVSECRQLNSSPRLPTQNIRVENTGSVEDVSGGNSPDHSTDFKFSTDSSYGSLTRQSTPEKAEPVTTEATDDNEETPKLSRFCYECGSEFMVLKAKFCMYCGVKRVII